MVREQIKGQMTGFFDFVRERGVAGFAIGFILGGATQKLVQALIDDLVNPLVGLLFGNVQSLTQYAIGQFKIGEFVSALLNFLLLSLVVYTVFKVLGLEKADKPKS
ncbi:MscL family protein [Candidatus Kaiserbacteria bacterium]|nr:MscL family protein [Candidatus Kaiserbacteria bacterium]